MPINVDDVAVSVAFYTEVLGLSVRTDRPDLCIDGAWLDAGDQQVHLLEAPIPPNMGQHLSLLVTGMDAAVNEIRVAVSSSATPWVSMTTARPSSSTRRAMPSSCTSTATRPR